MLERAFHLSMGSKAMDEHRRGNLSTARSMYEAILQERPNDAVILDSLATLFRQQHAYAEALKTARRAAAICPQAERIIFNLGECCRATGLFEEAIAAYKKALELNFNIPWIHTGLGQAYLALNCDADALLAFRNAVKFDSQTTRAHEHLSACLMRCGEFKESESVASDAAARDPKNPSHHGRLGALLARRGDWGGAVARFQKAATLRPDWAEPQIDLARAFNCMNLPQAAAEAATRATELDMRNADAWFELGVAMRQLRQFTRGAAAFTETLALRPNDVNALIALAGIEQERLGHTSSLYHFRQAAEQMAAASHAQSRLLIALNYSDGTEDQEIFHEHERWGRRITVATSRGTDCIPPNTDADRPLRVGYLSADLRKHPVPCFLEPILAGHDPARVVPVVFCDVERADAVTARLHGQVREWHEVHGLSSAALADKIRAERIDILVDLAGHAPRNRLHAFAMRAAPVQVSYLGYPNTTGLPREIMNYRLTDELCDPVGQTEKFHTEQLVRLPGCFLCYRPPNEAPDVAPPPALKGKGVTFGCFNHIVKVTRPMIARWSEILRRVPGSRLLMKSKMFADAASAAVVRDAFAENGIGESRLVLTPYADSYVEHLATYGKIDIALDTFPYHGTTTTCETMWMGVPVVTWVGEVHRSRVGKTLLTAVGLEELITESAESYIDCAVELAGDIDRLTRLRKELRPRMAASRLRDEPGFVRNLESAYREMWIDVCDHAPALAGAAG